MKKQKENDSNALLFRFATTEDAQAIAEIWQEAFHDTAEYIADYWNRYFHATRIRVAEQNGQVVAMCSLFPVTDPIDHQEYCYLYALAVPAQKRGQGIATNLLQDIASFGKPLLLQPEQNGVASFYQERGFRLVPAEKLSRICRENGILSLTVGEFDGMEYVL